MLKKLGVTLLGVMMAMPVVQAADDELVVYSGRSDKFVKPVIKAFTRETGIKVILHSAKSTALLNKLKIEGERTHADLYLSNDAGNLQLGSQMGLFQPLPKNIVDVIDPELRAEDDTWVGLSARARVLVANTKVDTSFVKSVFDLADPRLKGRIAVTHSGNGSFIAGVTVYMEAAGVEKTRKWLEGVKKNADGRTFNKHSKVVKAVASGKRAIGLVNHYYIYRHLDKSPDAPIKVIVPDQADGEMGVAWNVAGIAISRYSKKSAAAIQFVEYLVSEKGQKLFSEVNREYPARKDVAASTVIPAADTIRRSAVEMATLGKQRNATIDLLEAVGMP
ncbi:MAG: extracellular solute-binding protein [Gammaproteobacteria bacterium]|nr:extracellular solute-binding protein [Gammaproteobacteria bacterium]